MKVGDLVRMKEGSIIYRSFRDVGTEKVGVVTEVLGDGAVYVRFEGITEDLISMTIMIGTYYLDIVSEAQK